MFFNESNYAAFIRAADNSETLNEIIKKTELAGIESAVDICQTNIRAICAEVKNDPDLDRFHHDLAMNSRSIMCKYFDAFAESLNFEARTLPSGRIHPIFGRNKITKDCSECIPEYFAYLCSKKE